MSDSEKTDELDNYGVWVKNTPNADDASADTTASTDFNLDADLPDFSSLDAFDDTVIADTAETTEAAADTQTAEAGGEEDISLDEFITGGEFEDVAEGNRGYGQAEAPAEPAASGEESVSLDDFLDLDSLNDAPAQEEAAPAETTEESPLDIDLAFDDSADTLATETVEADVAEAPAEPSAGDDLAGTESIDLSEFGFDDSGEPSADAPAAETAPAEETPAASEETVTETAAADASTDNFDDMFNALDDGGSIDASAFFDEEPSEAAAETAPVPAAESTAASSGEEEVDLSDFGFDDSSTASQGEVKDSTKTAGGQEDYDMTVTVDDDEGAPSVSAPQESAPVAEVPAASEPIAPAPQAQADVSPAATAILSQIVGELNSLRTEIADLKNDFEEMKNKGISEPAPVETESATSDIPDVATSNIPGIPVPTEQAESETGGFFDGTDEDETISLSTDELSNILNNADFQTETVEAEGESPLTEETVTETAEETTTETVTEETSVEEPTVAETGTDASDIPEIPEPTEQAENETGGFFDGNDEDETISLSSDELGNILNSADFQTETVEAEGETPLTEESTAETAAEETVTETAAEETTTETVTEETAIEETVTAEESETAQTAEDDFGFDSIEQGEAQELPEEISVPKVEDEAQEEPSAADAFPSTDGMEVIDLSEEQPLEIVDLSAEAEEQPAQAEENAPEAPAPEAEQTPDVPETTAGADDAISGDLKQEIKSVLSYMDQLLENLPEDKIAEFAQSEQFEAYKKLFKELGLA